MLRNHIMILGVNLGYPSKKLYPLINDQYTVRPDEAFLFANDNLSAGDTR
jgi:hypothetical protein